MAWKRLWPTEPPGKDILQRELPANCHVLQLWRAIVTYAGVGSGGAAV